MLSAGGGLSIRELGHKQWKLTWFARVRTGAHSQPRPWAPLDRIFAPAPRPWAEADESRMRRAAGYDLLVIGGGAAGLAASRAAPAGRRVALVERGRPGGDCTFSGCVPSKTLLETARRVAIAGNGARYGFEAPVAVDFPAVMARVHAVVEEIAGAESTERLRSEGIEVLVGEASFLDEYAVDVEGRGVTAGRIVVAVGSRPQVPPIEGLEAVGPLTNETVFALGELPRRLLVLGGGAIGAELAQAFARLGSSVVLVEAAARILPEEEPEASETIAAALRRDGVEVLSGARVIRAAAGPTLELADGTRVEGSHLLVAAGRRPATQGLGLDRARVATGEDGLLVVDATLQTSRPHIYGAGDCATHLRFTHVADEQGRLAAGNAFRRHGRPFRARAVPRVTFTDPEVGRVGLTEAEAFDAYGEGARVAFLPLAETDRARCAGETDGFVKLIAGPRPLLGTLGGGVVLGMTAVAPRGGELVAEIALAAATRAFAGRLAQTIHAYPTWSTAVRQAAAQWFGEFGGRTWRPARRLAERSSSG